jgi:hypothetical protein
LDGACRRREEHDVADDGDTSADEHQWAADLVLIGEPAGEQDCEECAHVWGHGEELRFDLCVSQRPDDGGEEERVGVDGRNDGEEVEGEHDGVDVEEGAADPVPGELFLGDGFGGGGAVGVKTHAGDTCGFLFRCEELDVGGGVREDEEDGNAEDDGYGALDEEDERLDNFSMANIGTVTQFTHPLYPPE